MPEKSFGIKELSVIGSGTPQIQSVEQLNIRTGYDSVTGIGSTVVIGSKDSDFTSPAPGKVDTNNKTVLNVGIVTANEFWGELKGGSIDPDIAITNANNVQITDDTTRAGLHYIHFGSATSGYDGVEVDGHNDTGTQPPSGLVYQDGKLGVGTIYPAGRFSVYGNKNTHERFGIAQTTGTDYYPWNTETGEPIAGQYQISDVVLNGGAGIAEATQVKGVLNMGASYLEGESKEAGTGSFRALKLYLFKDSNIDNAYGLGMSDGMLEIQSSASLALYAGKEAGVPSGTKSERLRINAEGHVGIGTTNPIYGIDGTGANGDTIKEALENNNKVLAVGIVTAHEYFGTFKGTIADTVLPDKADKAEKIKVQSNDVNAVRYLTFVDAQSGYEDLYVNTKIQWNSNWYDNSPNTGSGKLTIDGDVGIAGTVTYEDVTNVDSLGIITARTGLHVGAGISVVGIATFYEGIETVSIGATIGNPYIKSGDGYCTAGAFSQGFSGVTENDDGYEQWTKPLIGPIGNYIPIHGEKILFTFSEAGKETRTYIFEYDANTSYPDEGKCALANITEYKDLNSTDNTKRWGFSRVALEGSYSIDWAITCRNYYTESDASFRIQVGSVLSIKSAVGIGTSIPFDHQGTDRGGVLAVAGIVTATEYYGTFKGDIDPDTSGTIEQAKKIYIQNLTSDTGVAFQIPFASSVLMPEYKNLYFDTDNTLAYSPSKEQLSVQDLSLGGDLEVTGISTFTEGAVVTGAGVSIHSGGLNVKAGISTFIEGAVVTGAGVSIHSGGLYVKAGIATFYDEIEVISIGSTTSLAALREQAMVNKFSSAYPYTNTQKISNTTAGFNGQSGYYAPGDGELVYLEFSGNKPHSAGGGDGGTRIFAFYFNPTFDFDDTQHFSLGFDPAQGGASSNTVIDYKDFGSATHYHFSRVSVDAPETYSTDWYGDARSYYDLGDSTFKIKVLANDFRLKNGNSIFQGSNRIASGVVGIGTTFPTDPQTTDRQALLAVAGIVTATEYYGTFKGDFESGTVIGKTDTIKITEDEGASGTNYLWFGDSNTQDAYDGLEIDKNSLVYDDGVLVVGNNASLPHVHGGTYNGKLQLFTKDVNALDIFSFGTDAEEGGTLNFNRNRANDYTNRAQVQHNDCLGQIDFRGMNINSDDDYELGASIRGYVDGVPGNSATDMPGRLEILTTPNGSTTPNITFSATEDRRVNVGGGKMSTQAGFSDTYGVLNVNVQDTHTLQTHTALNLVWRNVSTPITDDFSKFHSVEQRISWTMCHSDNANAWRNAAYIGVGKDGSPTVDNDWSADSKCDAYLSFGTSKGTLVPGQRVYERMRIDSDGHVGIGTSVPSDTNTSHYGGEGNTKILSVGKLQANFLYGDATNLINVPGGGTAGQVDVAAVTSDDNFYHLTFVGGISGAQDVKVSAGVTVRNDHLYANHITARGYNDPASLMNQASIHSDGGLELRRNNHNVTSGGPYIDFTKNIVSYPDIETIGLANNTFTTSTNIIQREWTTAASNITPGTNIIGSSNHDLASGDPVRYIKSSATGTDAEIGGITPGITYYAIKQSNTHFKLCATEADAKSASPTPIDITSAGSGDHTFKLGTLNTGDVLTYKGATTGDNINVTVNAFVFIVKDGNNLNKFKIATSSVYNALDGTVTAITSGSATQKFEVSGMDFDARIQLDSLNTDDASILFRTPIPGTSLPSATGKSKVRLEVTREGAVVSGIMTVAYGSDRLNGTENYIQAGIGTHFIREADADELVLTRDYRSKMIVFDKDIQTDDDKTVKILYNVFGYGDSMTFYNAGTKICTINANNGNVRIYLAGTNVYAALGYGTPGNTGKVFLSPKAMATLTYTHHDGVVDDFVITGGGVYV